MIELTLNRNAAYTFVRFMDWRFSVTIPDKSWIRNYSEPFCTIWLTPEQVNLFRQRLKEAPEKHENAEGVLRMLGTFTEGGNGE